MNVLILECFFKKLGKIKINTPIKKIIEKIWSNILFIKNLSDKTVIILSLNIKYILIN